MAKGFVNDKVSKARERWTRCASKTPMNRSASRRPVAAC